MICFLEEYLLRKCFYKKRFFLSAVSKLNKWFFILWIECFMFGKTECFNEKMKTKRVCHFCKKRGGKNKKKQNKTHKFLRKRMSTLTWEYILSKFPKTNDGTFEFRRQKIENKWSYYLRLLAVKNCSLLIPSQSPNLLGINRNISKA